MSDFVQLTENENVAVITFNNPPVNALNEGVLDGIVEAMAAASADASVRAIVITGGGALFCAGADIAEFAKSIAAGRNDSPEFHLYFKQLEDSAKPIVMAIHGSALGGGLELAMAGHYRVATPDAVVGQPEVNLGIIPGAEGTQRLPRLVGLAKALELCISGQILRASEAAALGIIDRVLEGELLAGAVQFAREVPADTHGRKTSQQCDKLGPAGSYADLLKAGKEQARKTRRNLLAALTVVDALEGAVTLPFDEGCKRERELVAKCLASDQAKALIHAFLAERGASKIPGIPAHVTARVIRQAAIIGSGTMGSGIAMAFANAGVPVLLTDSDPTAIDRGVANIRKNYENSVKKGRLSTATMQERLNLIRPQLTWSGLEEADVIIEAVFENIDLKKRVFGQIDKVAKPSCLISSNTSSLDIDELAQATSRPEAVIGLHFFSPANVMRLVEVVRGKLAGKETIATAMALAKKLKKVGVLVGNSPGFVGNRMMFPYMREAQFLLEEGATPSQVDAALYNWGMAMGILAVDDMAGIDVAYKVNEANKHLRKPGVRVPLVLDQLYHMGRFGQKTGKGWFRYDENRRPSPDPEVEALIEKTAKDAGISRRKIDDEEIIERCIYGMINEGARILEEGHALRAADIDTIYLTGFGFPAYRGGPMWYADTVGLQKVLSSIEKFQQQHGELWTPAPLLKRLVAEKKTFAALDGELSERAAYA